MPERSTVFEISQLGVESVFGTSVPAARRLQSLKIVPKIETKTTNFAPQGYAYDTVTVVDQEWTSAKVDGVGDYNDLIQPLSSLFGAPTPTTPTGGTLTQAWVFNPLSTAQETPKSFTIEAGSASRAGKFSYGLFSDFGFTSTRKDFKVTGAIFGQKYTDGITMTAAPSEVQTLSITGTPTGGNFTLTYAGQTTAPIVFNAAASAVVTALTALPNIGAGGVTATGGPLPGSPVVITFAGTLANMSRPLITANGAGLTGGTSPAASVVETTPGGFDVLATPIMPTQTNVSIDTSAANLGNTVITRPFSFSWNLTGKWGPLWPIGSTNPSWAVHIPLKPKSELKLLVEADATGMGYLTNFRSAGTLFIRHSAVGPVIEGSLNYLYNADFAAKITSISEFKDQEGVWATEYTLGVVHDATWGQSMAHTVYTKQASL